MILIAKSILPSICSCIYSSIYLSVYFPLFTLSSFVFHFYFFLFHFIYTIFLVILGEPHCFSYQNQHNLQYIPAPIHLSLSSSLSLLSLLHDYFLSLKETKDRDYYTQTRIVFIQPSICLPPCLYFVFFSISFIFFCHFGIPALFFIPKST